MPGFFIVIEGIDGAGKTTLSFNLKKELEKRGYSVLITSEPTQGKYGRELIRKIKNGAITPEEELELFFKDRKEHVEKVLRPALSEGKIVICDRYFYSTCAYQGARGLDYRKICRMNGIFPEPDLVILLDLPPEQALGRKERKERHFEREDFLQRVREIYLEVIKSSDYEIIDASLPREEVLRRALKCLEKYLKG